MWQIDVQAAQIQRERRAEADAYRRAAGGPDGSHRVDRGRARKHLGRALIRTGRRLLGEPAPARPA